MNKSPYSRIVSYVLPSSGFFILSSIGYLLFALSQVGIADWFRQIVDYIAQPNPTLTIYLPLLLLLLAFGRGLGYFLGNFFMALVSTRLVHDLRNDLFKSLIYLPSKFYDSNTSGHLLSRITFNVMQINEAGTAAITILIREGLIVIGLLSYLFYLNWKLTAFLFITAPFILFVVSIAGKRMKRVSTRIQNSMGDVTQVSSESINANKEIKIFGRQISEFDKFKKVNDDNRSQNLKLETTNSLQSPVIQFILAISLAFISWIALDSSVIERMTPGTFIAFFGAAAMLPRPIRQLSTTNSMIQKGIAAAEIVFSQMDIKPENNLGRQEIEKPLGKLDFSDVNFSYKPGLKTLENISFSLSQGETLALVGHSGSGKSTLVNLIPKFYELNSGNIYVDDIDINEVELENLRSLISVVSQNTILFNDTVFNNVKFAKPEANEDEIIDACKKSNAHEFIESLPNGYQTKVGEDGTLLSGGQKQRIAIARALLKNSPYLILDEATSALDSESETLIQQAIENLKEGKTTIVIAHRLSTVESADKILVLEKGKVLEEGSHQELISSKGLYFDLYKNQFKDSDLENSETQDENYEPKYTLSELKTSNIIEDAWYANKFWIKILWPISLIYRFLYTQFKNKALEKSWKPEIKTIVIGNLTVGGSGKTQFVIWLSNFLKSKGMKPGIISRGYKSRSSKFPLLVDHNSSADLVGDEPLIIKRNTKCPVAVGPNRINAAKYLLENSNCDVLISDDGLQHFQLGRDIEVIMVDGLRKFGNQMLLPAGPLREPLQKLDQSNYVVNTNQFWSEEASNKDNNFLMSYKPVSWINLTSGQSISINSWKEDKIVYGIAGIGNPDSFFSLLRSLGFQVIEKIFPDHHEFISSDFDDLDDLPVIMTEKDAVKCNFINKRNYWYLKIEANLEETFKEKFLEEIKS